MSRRVSLVICQCSGAVEAFPAGASHLHWRWGAGHCVESLLAAMLCSVEALWLWLSRCLRDGLRLHHCRYTKRKACTVENGHMFPGYSE